MFFKKETTKATRRKRTKAKPTTAKKKVTNKQLTLRKPSKRTAKKKLPIRKSSKQLAIKDKRTIGTFFSKVTLLSPFKKNPLARMVANRSDKKIEGKLALAFQKLHAEFSHREQQLELRMQEIKVQQEILLEQKQKRSQWLIPIALAAALAGGYMLYVLTSMQHSMSSMTGSIDNMDGNMAAMSGDMRYMSQNVQMMNQSMYQMNGNVRGMTKAMEPMGDVAQAASPFTKMFKSIMPF